MLNYGAEFPQIIFQRTPFCIVNCIQALIFLFLCMKRNFSQYSFYKVSTHRLQNQFENAIVHRER